MTVFILQNQHGQFLNKENQWISVDEASALFRSAHYDIALNHLIEINTRDHGLRAAVIACKLDSKGRPVFPSTATVDQDTDSPHSTTPENIAVQV